MARKKICPGCGTKLLKTARTCDVCSLFFLDCKPHIACEYEATKARNLKGINWFKLGMIFFSGLAILCVVAIVFFVICYPL